MEINTVHGGEETCANSTRVSNDGDKDTMILWIGFTAFGFRCCGAHFVLLVLNWWLDGSGRGGCQKGELVTVTKVRREDENERLRLVTVVGAKR